MHPEDSELTIDIVEEPMMFRWRITQVARHPWEGLYEYSVRYVEYEKNELRKRLQETGYKLFSNNI